MTSWGTGGPGPLNTRVYIDLSRLQSDANAMTTVTVQGSLTYAVPNGYFVVIIRGCGTSKVTCTVTDKNNRNVCRWIETCVPTGPAALDAARKLYDCYPCSATLAPPSVP